MNAFTTCAASLRANLALAAALAIMLLVMGPAQAANLSSGLRPGTYVPGEILVKFRDATPSLARTQILASYGSSRIKDLTRTGLVHVSLPPGQDVESAIAAYQSDPDVEFAQPNYVYKLLAVPNDPNYGQLWGLKNTGQTVTSAPYPTNNPGVLGMDMNAELAWAQITDCTTVVVAVLDSGVNYNHVDLASNMWNSSDPLIPNHGWDYVNNDNDPMDTNGHGTHVAGTIGAVGNNATGTTGVCWAATIMAVRIADTVGNAATANVVQGVDFAIANGARVINMSLGGPNLDPTLSDAISRARNAGVVVVVAAGNEASNNDATPVYPCNFTHDNLLCVAAVDQAFALANFSNFGATSVDVGAPGTNIMSEWPGTETTITDDFHTPGTTLNWTTAATPPGTGWVYGQRTVGGQVVDVLLNPFNFPFSGTYTTSTNDRVYKQFNLFGADVAVLNFGTQFEIQAGDFLRINYRSAGGDPFGVGGVQLDSGNGSSGGIIGLSYDLTGCISTTCSVGFQLLTDGIAAPAGSGVGILDFSITKLQFNPTSYKIINGTSMASPHVAGLAAMIMAYNPAYTYLDVVNSVKNGGTPIPALAGKSTTGKAVNAMGSLAHILPPTGLTAVAQ